VLLWLVGRGSLMAAPPADTQRKPR
jgi:hypothetical protein